MPASLTAQPPLSIPAIDAFQLQLTPLNSTQGRVHPTINHDDPEDGVDFDVVANVAQAFDVKIALSNSFGFGGHNSSCVFGKYEA